MPVTQSDYTTRGTPFAWLSVEVSLWVLLFIVALALRLLRLDAAPLNTTEAQDALAAWRFAQGDGAPSDTGYSPVLFSGQWLTFLLVTANDWTARLLPALAGTFLVLTPSLLRKPLGRVGALLTAVLLTLSPTALFLSRFASGDILVALGAMLCVGGIWRFLDGAQVARQDVSRQLAQPLVLSAVGVALMLTAGPLAYSATIAIVAALALLALVDPAFRDLLGTGWAKLQHTPNLAYYALGGFASGFVLFSTAFSWHYGGLAAAADLISQWLAGFVRWPDSLSPGYPGVVMIAYEPLILLAGLAGTVLAVNRRDPISKFFALWSILALLLGWIRPGRTPGDVLLVLLPLACLGGVALAHLIDSTRRHGHWSNEGLFLAITLPLWAYLLINLANYSSQPGEYSRLSLLIIDVSLPTFLSLAMVAGFLLFVVTVGIGFVYGPASALRGLALSVTVALFIYTIATSIGISQQRSNDPRELLVREPTAPEARLLADTLSHISNKHSGGEYAVDLTLLTDDPALAWLLRDFKQARVVEPSGSPISTSIVVAPQTLGTPTLDGEYVGQSFALRRRWEPGNVGCRWNLVQIGEDQVTQLDCNTVARWLVYRRSPDQPVEEKAILWLRRDLVGW